MHYFSCSAKFQWNMSACTGDFELWYGSSFSFLCTSQTVFYFSTYKLRMKVMSGVVKEGWKGNLIKKKSTINITLHMSVNPCARNTIDNLIPFCAYTCSVHLSLLNSRVHLYIGRWAFLVFHSAPSNYVLSYLNRKASQKTPQLFLAWLLAKQLVHMTVLVLLEEIMREHTLLVLWKICSHWLFGSCVSKVFHHGLTLPQLAFKMSFRYCSFIQHELFDRICLTNSSHSTCQCCKINVC